MYPELRMIYFDFDRTLIDTDALKEEQSRRISAITQLPLDDIVASMPAYIATLHDHLDFSVSEYASYLESVYQCNPSDVLKVYLTDSNYISDFLFPEVMEVLYKLRAEGVTLGIFSSAQVSHQRIKIERTGVLEYIPWANVIIAPRKLHVDVISQLPDGATVVDDDKQIVEEIRADHPRITPIWCNRKSSETIKGIRTITTLRDLLRVNTL